MTIDADITVIGAGVIGISAALELQRRGHKVLVIDAEGVAQGASFGNAGAFAFTDVLPLATPRIMRQAPRWLFDPLGPLSIPPSYALRIAPWLFKFWRASRPEKFATATTAQSQLMALARHAVERQIAFADCAHLVVREGQLQLYDTKRSFKASLPDWALRKSHGIAFDIIQDAATLAAIQPGLNAKFQHGVFTPAWMNTVNPKSWVDHLAAVFCQIGGEITTTKAHAINVDEYGVRITTSDTPIRSKQVVIAAGAHSHILARNLGDRIPLETERGYNTSLPSGAFDLRTHLSFASHGFVVSKLDDGVRVGGAVELGGLDAPPNYKRATHLLNKASEFLPNLKTAGGTQWMGFRPSLPDSLPVISRARHAPDVIYAFGHGHLGLTQSAATAELVADLAENKPPAIDVAPFSAERF
jgi:D-amino-acid dehydrogenase